MARWQDWQDDKREAMAAQPLIYNPGLLELPDFLVCFFSQDSLLLRLLQQTRHRANPELVQSAANR